MIRRVLVTRPYRQDGDMEAFKRRRATELKNGDMDRIGDALPRWRKGPWWVAGLKVRFTSSCPRVFLPDKMSTWWFGWKFPQYLLATCFFFKGTVTTTEGFFLFEFYMNQWRSLHFEIFNLNNLVSSPWNPWMLNPLKGLSSFWK